MTIRVLVCDDHPVFRRGLCLLLADVDCIEVVAEAADGEEGLRLAIETRPDVAVMDLNLPGCGGVETTKRMLAELPGLAVLVLTMFDDDHLVLAALRAGARGFLLKGATAEQVSAAIQTLAAGEMLLGGSVAARMSSLIGAAPRGRFPQLSEREEQVLALVAAGRSNPEIARSLFLSDKTIRNYVSTMMTKLAVPSRAALIALSRDASG